MNLGLLIMLSSICLAYLFPLKKLSNYLKNNIINTRLFSRQSSSFHGYNQSQPKLEAYEIAKTSSITMPVIILVNPFLDQNVGSVSRAMLNFGLHELRIVDPACNITSENALALAAGAYEVLDNAKVFPTLEEAISDLQRVFATTVRLRALNHIIYTPRAAAEVIINLPTPSEDNEQDEQTTPIKCGILFGRERNGLYNEEVNLADSIISIPTFNHFTSLNLAQAVNIVGYELWNRKIALDQSAAPPVWFQPKSGDRLARKVELDNFLTRLEKRLVDREYQKEKSREALYFQIIRNIFQRSMLSLADIDLLHGVVATLTDPKHRQLDWTKIDEIESKDPVYTPVSGEYLNKLLKEKIAVQKEKLLQAQALKKAQQGDPKIQTD